MNLSRLLRNVRNSASKAQASRGPNAMHNKRLGIASRTSKHLTVESLEQRQFLSVNAELLEINTAGAGGVNGVRPFDVVNGQVYLRGSIGVTPSPSRFWITDGTEAGTNPLSVDSNFPTLDNTNGAFIAASGTFYFRGMVGVDAELWKSDGTVSGTVLVKDINSTGSSNVGNLIGVGDNIFFTADNGQNGLELWMTDGTAAGTAMVKDIKPGADPSLIANLTNVNGTVFFTADDGVNGLELWKSDGTEAGTVLVKDIHPGASPEGVPNSSQPFKLTNLNGTLVFAADDGATGSELWRSDGTTGGTVLIKDFNDGPLPFLAPTGSPLTLHQGVLYFSGITASNGPELWRTDGTEAGTKLVRDINPGAADSRLNSIISRNDVLLFTATDGVNGAELWRSDGTEAGTQMVKDLIPGPTGSALAATPFYDASGTVYFPANTVGMGVELWKTDGTEAGTQFVADLNPGPGSSNPVGLYHANGTVLLGAADARGRELWKTDGTAAGTTFVKDVNTNDWGSAFVTDPLFGNGFANYKGKLFFGADAGVNTTDWDLWATDGTQAGTTKVKDINPGIARNLMLTSLTVFKDHLYFAGDDGRNGVELWRSDGTDAGTTMVKNINPARADGIALPGIRPVELKDRLYFPANDGQGDDLWATDGTEAGTLKVKDLSLVGGPIAVNSQFLLFAADDGVNGIELWRSDGTDAGTTLLKDIHPGAAGSAPYGFRIVNGSVFFFADNGTDGIEMWRTDGTEAGTIMVADINPGPSGVFHSSSIVVGDTLYFLRVNVIDDVVTGEELWKSDGTAAGTSLVKGGFKRLTNGWDNYSLTSIDRRVYFLANTDAHGDELWTSDGTSEGTRIVRDIMPGPAGSSNQNGSPTFATVHGALYFTANDGVHGLELWKSDGTADGTVLVTDAIGGVEGSDPKGIHVSNDRVFFTGRADSFRELFSFPLQPVGTPGDFNGDRILDVVDINGLSAEMIRGTHDARFDLNSDQLVDQVDHRVWVEQIMQTWYGDSNLDGQFDTRDLISTLQRGEYEDEIIGNSTWSDGDWNGDGDFTSEDLTFAFKAGGYLGGRRVAVAAVPDEQTTRVDFDSLAIAAAVDSVLGRKDQRLG